MRCGHLSLRSCCCTSRMSRRFHSPRQFDVPVTQRGDEDDTPTLKSTETLRLRAARRLVGEGGCELGEVAGVVCKESGGVGSLLDRAGCAGCVSAGEVMGESTVLRIVLKGKTSSGGTFSPKVRWSFARRFRRVSVTVATGEAGVSGVLGSDVVLVESKLADSGVRGTWTRGSEGGSGTALRRRTRGVGRGALRLLLALYSRLCVAKDFGGGKKGAGVGADARELARDVADELAEEVPS